MLGNLNFTLSGWALVVAVVVIAAAIVALVALTRNRRVKFGPVQLDASTIAKVAETHSMMRSVERQVNGVPAKDPTLTQRVKRLENGQLALAGKMEAQTKALDKLTEALGADEHNDGR